jgi:hypothetical protein
MPQLEAGYIYLVNTTSLVIHLRQSPWYKCVMVRFLKIRSHELYMLGSVLLQEFLSYFLILILSTYF